MSTRANFAFVAGHPAHFVAFGFGSGLSPVAPGTAGTLLALVIYWLVKPEYSDAEFGVLTVAAFVLGVWACGRTGRDLGIPDYGGMVWDEMVAFWMVLLLVPDEIGWQAGAFVLFRFFDIAKPQPIGHFDQEWKGGFGVMFDDLLAGFFTLLLLALARFAMLRLMPDSLWPSTP
jgi:phosphatidylglycerophosphatase A